MRKRRNPKITEALNGKTPSEAPGITIEGENKWQTLIGNASKKAKSIHGDDL
jgi:hypothetical protein